MLKIKTLILFILLFLISNISLAEDIWIDATSVNQPINLKIPLNNQLMISCVKWLNDNTGNNRWEIGAVKYINGAYSYKITEDKSGLTLAIDKEGFAHVVCIFPTGETATNYLLRIDTIRYQKPDNNYLYLNYGNESYRFFNGEEDEE